MLVLMMRNGAMAMLRRVYQDYKECHEMKLTRTNP